MQRCSDLNHDIYACFVDSEKAIEKVQHEKFKNILKSKDIDNSDIKIICNLYWCQTATVKVKNELTEIIEILRGVRQDCISPILFSVYSEAIFQETLTEITEGETINNIRFTDDSLAPDELTLTKTS